MILYSPRIKIMAGARTKRASVARVSDGMSVCGSWVANVFLAE